MDRTAGRQTDLLEHYGLKIKPGYFRDQIFTRERVTAQTSGGSDSQRLRGTVGYREACNELNVP